MPGSCGQRCGSHRSGDGSVGGIVVRGIPFHGQCTAVSSADQETIGLDANAECGGSETFEEANGFSVAVYDWKGGGLEKMGNSPTGLYREGSTTFTAFNAIADGGSEENVW